MRELASSHDWSVVALSFAISVLTCYVGLHLARRVRSSDRAVALGWRIGGSLVLGTGVWAAHFIGVMGLHLPFPLKYELGPAFVSWLAATVAAAAALKTAGMRQLHVPKMVLGTSVLAAGLAAAHYAGMATFAVSPGIAWHGGWMAVSAALSAGIAGLTIYLFFWQRNFSGSRGMAQATASVALGLALGVAHHATEAAARFPEGMAALNGGMSGEVLRPAVAITAIVMLLLTLATALLDARRQRHSLRLADSLRTANEKLRGIVYQDPLTGLANRPMFQERLDIAMKRCEREEHSLAVLCIDLDGFKPINDSFGQAGGDAVLCEVAQRLRALVQDTGLVARVGADEFMIFIHDEPDGSQAAHLGRNILDSLSQPYGLAEREVAVSCSVGIVMFPQYGPRDKLVGRANAAMLASKRAGGSIYTFFEPRMEADVRDQADLLRDLRGAIDRGELELYYQPKIGVVSGQITAAEALLRWHHPTRGMIPPGVFIPIAERYGLVVALGNWVIEAACRQIRDWGEQGLRMCVAVNLSAYQLRQERLPELIKSALARNRVDPSYLTCEITESVAMEDTLVTQAAFERLGQSGIRLSIDDFGTGYSSLAYLRKLPAVELKIDRSFVTDLETNGPDACAIIDAVIHLAHALGLKVVAEGVETERQRATLIEMGCDELQGFLFAKPMPARALAKWAMDEEQSRSMALGLINNAPSVREAMRKASMQQRSPAQETGDERFSQ